MRISLKGNQPSSSRGTANTFVEPANARAAAETVGWSDGEGLVGFDVGGGDQPAVFPGEREQCILVPVRTSRTAPRVGLEPTTLRLTAECSAN